MTYLLFLVGLAGLFLGGDMLIRGAVGVAQRFRVPPLIIGLTIVGFGTSMPELLVSVQAALAGAPALAIGNVIGSNVANILLILGATAVISAIPMRLGDLSRSIAVMIGTTVVLWLLLAMGMITRPVGVALLAALAIYLWFSLRDSAAPDTAVAAIRPAPVWRSVLFTVIGLICLILGARFLVLSATEIARAFGISEAVIGLTVIALGTSLPELAASVAAALRRHPEIAVGNVIGSNIFNILGILGTTAAIVPIPVDPRFVGTDMALAATAALLLGVFAIVGGISRLAGVMLLSAYAAYIAMAVG